MTTRTITEYAQLLWGLSLLFVLTRSFLDLRGGVWLWAMTLVAVIVLASTTVWLTADYVRNRRRPPSL